MTDKQLFPAKDVTDKQRTIALVGNPNSGKSTLFNALTGRRQRTGNWSGVTVEKKVGECGVQGACFSLIDLPGCYALDVVDSTALDERIACDYLASGEADLLINVLDAAHLERGLYLTVQLIEMGMPVIVVLNMMDVAAKQGLRIDAEKLSVHLGCPVVPVVAHKKSGLSTLKRLFVQPVARQSIALDYSPPIETAITMLLDAGCPERWWALRLLEGDQYALEQASPTVRDAVAPCIAAVQAALDEDIDILISDQRYRWVEQWTQDSVVQDQEKKPHAAWVDRIVLHRWCGVPVFLLVMYLMFFFAINVGGVLQDVLSVLGDAVFVNFPASVLSHWHAPVWLIALVSQGLGKGISTILNFAPVIAAMFFCLAFLEDSGYMARAACVVDRLMRSMGLSGHAFVPMIVGFGCNVPAVMATRTLASRRDRILTIMMLPFMSCGARLAIYALFTAAFFPYGGHNIIFLLYLIGIAAALLTGLALRRRVVNHAPTPFILELPVYHVPRPMSLLRTTHRRLWNFLKRAAGFILPLCLALSLLNGINLPGKKDTSLLEATGKMITPIFAPMGVTQDNWPATVGLISGVLAKEVVIGTMSTLYAHHDPFAMTSSAFSWHGVGHQLAEVWHASRSELTKALRNPLAASSPDVSMGRYAYGQMVARFATPTAAFAYLLFILLYFPCVSTIAAVTKELSRRWAVFSLAWTTLMAYAVAVSFYQLATFATHPIAALVWVAAFIATFFIMMKCWRLEGGLS